MKIKKEFNESQNQNQGKSSSSNEIIEFRDRDRTTKAAGETGIIIHKELVVKYGPSKGCKGCEYATGKIQGRRPHNDYCRKRFIELSEIPGNEDLKDVINKEFESIILYNSENLYISFVEASSNFDFSGFLYGS